MADRRFGFAWLAFAGVLGLHILDEAIHDFLSIYNPTAQAIRMRMPFVPLPTFTFASWLAGLLTGVGLLLCLSPIAFRRKRWIRVAASPLAIVVGAFNASLHMLGSVYFHRWMPGVYSSPLLLAAALFLLASAGSRSSD